MFDDQRVQTEIQGFNRKLIYKSMSNIEFTVEHWFIQWEINTSDHGKFNETHNAKPLLWGTQRCLSPYGKNLLCLYTINLGRLAVNAGRHPKLLKMRSQDQNMLLNMKSGLGP